tara:strand:+ start:461 stop:940 length:480 start_codon:yes stop_codon:yes gene_type:complete
VQSLLSKLLISPLTIAGIGFFSTSIEIYAQDCNLDSKTNECLSAAGLLSTDTISGSSLQGVITHVRDGDTFEVNGIPIRLAALDCPENSTAEGIYASSIAKAYQGVEVKCELTGARTYDRLVGYCEIRDVDFGRMMMSKSSCKLWKKFDVWDRYKDDMK